MSKAARFPRPMFKVHFGQWPMISQAKIEEVKVLRKSATHVVVKIKSPSPNGPTHELFDLLESSTHKYVETPQEAAMLLNEKARYYISRARHALLEAQSFSINARGIYERAFPQLPDSLGGASPAAAGQHDQIDGP